jgi:hypothetical protein
MFKYISDGQSIPAGQPFSDRSGIKRPSNWLERALPWELEEAGIKKYDDLPPLDPRFATGYDANDNVIWRPFNETSVAFKHQTQVKGNMLLHPTDWMVIRESDTGFAMNAAIKVWRQSIRDLTAQKLQAIAALSATPQLAAYAASDSYVNWPELDPALAAGAPSPNYRLFWDALVASTVYASIRTQSMASLPMNTLATEFIALIGDAKAGRPNEAAIQASMSAVFATGTFTEADAEEFTAALAAGLLDDIYSLT